MRSLGLKLGACWFASVLFVGCGSKTESPAPTVALEQLPEQLADAVCDHIGPCCQAVQIPFDAPSCKQTAITRVNKDIVDTKTANIRYDAAAAARCVALYAAAVQGCQRLDNAELVSACSATFVGTLPPGALCTQRGECAPGPGGERPICKSDIGDASSVCALEDNSITAKLGGACSGSCYGPDDSVCSFLAGDPATNSSTVCFASQGLYCSAAQTCQPLVPLGSSCRSEACVAGAFCESGTCVAARTTGPCQSIVACAAPSYCNLASGQCEPKKADGATCSESTDCVSGDCGYQQDSSSQRTCLTRQLASTFTCAGNFD